MQECLSATVHSDEHGAHVADERPQGTQIALVTDAANNNERGAVTEVGGKARHLDLPGEQLTLLAHVLDRVVGETLQCLTDLVAASLGLSEHAREVEHLPTGHRLPAARHLTITHGDRLAVGEHLEQRIVWQVDQMDARFDEQLGAEVRIGAAGGRTAVQHRADVRGDQLLG